jgi:hypothetical protein
MSERRHPALEQAYQEIPLRRSEVYPEINFVPVVGTFAGHWLTSSTLDGYHEFITQNQPSLAIIGAALYVIGTLVDRHSTHKFFDAANDAEAHGMQREHIEINPYTFGAQTRQELKSKKVLGFEALGAGLSALAPAFAHSLLTGRLLAARNNYRVAKRYRRAVEIAQSQQ